MEGRRRVRGGLWEGVNSHVGVAAGGSRAGRCWRGMNQCCEGHGHLSALQPRQGGHLTLSRDQTGQGAAGGQRGDRDCRVRWCWPSERFRRRSSFQWARKLPFRCCISVVILLSASKN